MGKSIVPVGTKVRVKPGSLWSTEKRPDSANTVPAGTVLEVVGNCDVNGHLKATERDEFIVMVGGFPAFGWVGDASDDQDGTGFDPDFEVVE